MQTEVHCSINNYRSIKFEFSLNLQITIQIFEDFNLAVKLIFPR